MTCLSCGGDPELGVLCRRCALEVVPCDGLIPDHIHSRTDSTDAEAWVVDGFGGAHAVAATTRIGRSHDRDLVVLANSVSRAHAELMKTEEGWTVHDLGSRNGTFVNGVRSQGRTTLPVRARIKVGDVALWFLSEVIQEPPPRPVMTTGGLAGGLMRYRLVHGAIEMCVVIGDDRMTGGALLWRAVGTEAWAERSLAPLEFQLLCALCARAHEEAASPSAVRGCVPTKQLAHDLPFQSKYANQENVRQIVLRLRGVLAEVGAGGILAVAPGRGYYLACQVTVAGAHHAAGADRG
ncbi:MAG TPA: FHA domain-containing protein [Kofleriaceae bacterium]|nr:FHA domain-containing protein [Kofleriaceae bacterium]